MITEDRTFEEYLIAGKIENAKVIGTFDAAYNLYHENLSIAVYHLSNNKQLRGSKPVAEAYYKKLSRGVTVPAWRVIWSTAWYIANEQVPRIADVTNRIIVPIEAISLSQSLLAIQYKQFRVEGRWELFDSEIWQNSYNIPGTMGYISKLVDEKENVTYEAGILLTLVKADSPSQFCYWLDHYITVNKPYNRQLGKRDVAWTK